MGTQRLNKEDLAKVRFSQEEAHDNLQHQILMNDLLRAQSLGNLEKVKVKIDFLLEDHSHGIVETTVWAVGPEQIMLKGGVNIPIRSVQSISII